MRVIGMLLGIPEQDQVAVRNKTDDNLRTVPGQPMEVRAGGGRQRRACSTTTSSGGPSTPPTT